MERFSLLPKKRTENVIANKVFNIALMIFFAVLLVIIVLIGIFIFLDRGIKSVEDDLAAVKKQQLNITEIEYSVFESKKIFLDKLKKEQTYWSEVFDIIDSNTLSSVLFLSFSNDPAKNKINMKAQTTSFNDAAEQLEMFRNVSEFKDAEISQISNDKIKGVVFDISLIYIK